MQAFPYKLYLVTDERACLGRNFFDVVEQAVKGGVDLVQLREKQLDDAAFLTKALRLKELLDRYNVPLIINDHVSVAMQTGSAGLHVGNSDTAPAQVKAQWPSCLLGYSIEYLQQLQTVQAQVSDYLAVSPVFATGTKQDTVTVWGLEGIAQIRSQTNKPLVAIGNINEQNAAAVIAAGADCLAVVSAICSAENPAKAAAQLREAIEQVTK
ncbi:thiamine phosphate synthase [Deminuibacter soli]|uniref:Thiamine-phosphate synthase n=1 Tax=Deminuibacter soli TaxID=2291815 RepID=A0A3E1NLG1_9BACT|nr:thiamine phosphate synthase [Deminuibacter soli]RFM28628.1 thiamine phosphate synthase [Deminuibacter soli]